MLVVVINQYRLFLTMPIIDVGLSSNPVLRGTFKCIAHASKGCIKCKF